MMFHVAVAWPMASMSGTITALSNFFPLLIGQNLTLAILRLDGGFYHLSSNIEYFSVYCADAFGIRILSFI